LPKTMNRRSKRGVKTPEHCHPHRNDQFEADLLMAG
jgi:hypothetical protein